jgi:predicted Rossmann fold nucleotide-binding protein DprA/Smf involved in DNA uptake
MEKKERTIDIIKQKRTVSESVIEGRKKFNNFKKSIKDALKDAPKTIPQIAAEIQMPVHETTYYLMAMQKFGDVVVDSLDDMDEYYFYKLK